MSAGVVVAIDGPAGAGKSTVSARVAVELGYQLIDTGAIYRALALVATESGVSWQDADALTKLVGGLDIRFDFQHGKKKVLLAGRDISEGIRTPQISMGASHVSKHGSVRASLLDLQRRLAGNGGAVLEGRDIGTVVCPGAQVKVFLEASPEVRANRRWQEIRATDPEETLESVRTQLDERDHQDSSREHAPMSIAEDAHRVDSTEMSIVEVVGEVVRLAREAEVAPQGIG